MENYIPEDTHPKVLGRIEDFLSQLEASHIESSLDRLPCKLPYERRGSHMILNLRLCFTLSAFVV
jgi:hypothetical protein